MACAIRQPEMRFGTVKTLPLAMSRCHFIGFQAAYVMGGSSMGIFCVPSTRLGACWLA